MKEWSWKKIKKKFEENQQIFSRKSSLKQTSLTQSYGTSYEGLGNIRNEMLKKFKEFLEGYEPILVTYIQEQEKIKYEDITKQNEQLKRERDDMVLKVEKNILMIYMIAKENV